MSRWKERRVLIAFAAAEHRPLPSRARLFIVQAITWFVLFALLFCLFYIQGFPTKRELAFVIGAFVAGAFTGALAVYDAAREQWPILRPYVDFGRIRARLSGSES